MIDYIRLLQTPFKKDGTDYSGISCYNLVKLILKEEHGVELPAFSDPNDRSLIQMLVHDNLDLVTKLDRPEYGAIVLLSIHSPYIHHFGIVARDETSFYHVSSGTFVKKTKLDDTLWKQFIRGFYKWKTK